MEGSAPLLSSSGTSSVTLCSLTQVLEQISLEVIRGGVTDWRVLHSYHSLLSASIYILIWRSGRVEVLGPSGRGLLEVMYMEGSNMLGLESIHITYVSLLLSHLLYCLQGIIYGSSLEFYSVALFHHFMGHTCLPAVMSQPVCVGGGCMWLCVADSSVEFF